MGVVERHHDRRGRGQHGADRGGGQALVEVGERHQVGERLAPPAQGRAVVVDRARHRPEPALPGATQQLGDQRRLADPGLALDHHESAGEGFEVGEHGIASDDPRPGRAHDAAAQTARRGRQRGARIEAVPLGDGAAGGVERGERLVAATEPGQGGHQQDGQRLAGAVAVEDLGDRRDHLLGAVGREQQLGAPLHEAQAAGAQRVTLVAEPRRRRAAPERLARPLPQRRVDVGEGAVLAERAARGVEEPTAIDLHGRDGEPVSPALGDHGLVAEPRAHPPDHHRERVPRRPRQVPVPQPVDERRGVREPPGLQREQRHQRARPRRALPHDPRPDDRHRPEQPDVPPRSPRMHGVSQDQADRAGK